MRTPLERIDGHRAYQQHLQAEAERAAHAAMMRRAQRAAKRLRWANWIGIVAFALFVALVLHEAGVWGSR